MWYTNVFSQTESGVKEANLSLKMRSWRRPNEWDLVDTSAKLVFSRNWVQMKVILLKMIN